MSDPTFWIEARASGLLAQVLVTFSVAAGLVLKSRPFGKALKPATVTDVHRFLALLALGATAIHGLALVLDRSVAIPVLALVVPGLGPYRPFWTGVGVVAAEAMVLVYLSFSQRKRIGAKTWRRLHWSTYGIFVALVAHGVMAGSDSSRPWAQAVYVGSVGLVVTATAWRALVPPSAAKRRGGSAQPARAAR